MLVDVEVRQQHFSVLLIESAVQPEWIALEQQVDLVFKETEVTLAKGLSGYISTRNRIPCRVLHVERGELLSRVSLQFQQDVIVSAITTRALDSLHLRTDQEVEALVKSNEIALMKPLL
jgi:molybdate transport system regulatory protein